MISSADSIDLAMPVQPDLAFAAKNGRIDLLYQQLRLNPKILDDIENTPFIETPLHIAASAGQIRFAMEIMRLKPSFLRKLDEDGWSPIHHAFLQNRMSFVHRLIKFDKNLIRVQGREGVTLLHLTARTENFQFLIKLLETCPTSIEDVTIEGKTALHIALESNQIRIFKILVGWIQRAMFEDDLEIKLLNWKDEDGNTILHTAVIKNMPEAVKLLLNVAVYKNTLNFGQNTALDLSDCWTRNEEELNAHNKIRNMLCGAGVLKNASIPKVESYKAYIKPLSIYKTLAIRLGRQQVHISKELRSALMVVIVLFITSTYQVALNPPGGVWADNYNLSANVSAPHKAGKLIMDISYFRLLFVTNTLCFIISVAILAFLLPFNVTSILSFCPMMLLLTCYYISIVIVGPFD